MPTTTPQNRWQENKDTHPTWHGIAHVRVSRFMPSSAEKHCPGEKSATEEDFVFLKSSSPRGESQVVHVRFFSENDVGEDEKCGGLPVRACYGVAVPRTGGLLIQLTWRQGFASQTSQIPPNNLHHGEYGFSCTEELCLEVCVLETLSLGSTSDVHIPVGIDRRKHSAVKSQFSVHGSVEEKGCNDFRRRSNESEGC